MNKAKQRLMLEVAYDLIQKVFAQICNSKRDDDAAEYAQEILRRIIMLDKKLKGGRG